MLPAIANDMVKTLSCQDSITITVPQMNSKISVTTVDGVVQGVSRHLRASRPHEPLVASTIDGNHSSTKA